MGKRELLFVLAVGIVIWGVVIGFLLKTDLYRQEYNKFEDRGLARINITLNGVSLEEINGGSKEVKYEGNGLTLYDDGKFESFEGVEMKGRGNWTWGIEEQKKPYQIKFEDKVDLLGMGRARKWYLLANYLDASYLRNETALYVADMLGMRYSYDGEYVELYVDGDYRGLYYLTRAVEVGKGTVDLKNPLGVLVELDNIYGQTEDYYKTGNGDTMVVKDAVNKDLKKEAMESFLKSYNRFELAVQEGDYAMVEELVDVESMAQYYLLSEFIVNPDAYWTSFYFYKDGEDDKIHAGPGWDFDLSLANRVWSNWMGEDFYLPNETMVRKKELMAREMYEEKGLLTESGTDWYEMSLRLSHIMFDLMEMPEFRDEVADIYNKEMRGYEDELIWKIERDEKMIREAVEVDEKKWGKNGFMNEVKTMKEWIKERYRYFDEIYGSA